MIDSGAELAAQTVAKSTVSTRGDIGHTLDAGSWDLKALSYSRAVDAALGAALVTAWRNVAIGAAGYLDSEVTRAHVEARVECARDLVSRIRTDDSLSRPTR